MQQPDRNPNSIVHGIALAGLIYLSWWITPWYDVPGNVAFVWFVWGITAYSALTLAIKLFRF
ncbi:MAG: hypothetical protein ACFB2Z_11125 [Maricaulaceae bacterium]